MFEAVRSNKRVAQVILGVISLTFAFWGVESYLSDRTSSDAVAEVGGTKIANFEFSNALREQQDRMRAESETSIDSSVFDSPLFKRAVLDKLINQRVLAIYAAQNGLAVPDEALRQYIASVPAFQDNGQFSMSRYERAVRAQGMSVQGFQERLRSDLANQQVMDALRGGAVVPQGVAKRFLEAQLESRTVHMVQLQAADFEADVTLDPDEVQSYYDAHVTDYAVPARVKAAYVVLTPEAIKSQVSVTDDEIRAEYEQRKTSLGTPEERKASHILIEVAQDAPEADVEAARTKAEGLLETLKADPSKFEALARKESQDPGSAEQGGDLGFFERGMMTTGFEDAVFGAAATGLVPQLVRTEFGFHIVRVDAIRPSTTPTLASMRAQIEADLIEQAASRRFLEVAEQFANMVYEQPDGLAPVADQFGLKVEQTDAWIDAGSSQVGPYESEALVKALFSSDVLNDKHNTDAIDLGNNTLIAGRVLEQQSARQRSLDEVRSEVEARLREEKGATLAIEQGESNLAKLKAGESVDLVWGEKIELQRGAPGLPPVLVNPIFSVDGSKVPAYTGVPLPGAGYALFRIDAVKHESVPAEDERLKAIQAQYAQIVGDQDLRAFLNALRDEYEVKINANALASDER